MMLDHEYATMRHVEDSHWWYRVLRSRVRADVERLAAGGSLALLDAGCGTGGMLAHLKSAGAAGWSLQGIDLSPLAVEQCQGRGLTVQQASACDLPFGDAVFDVVLSLDVIYCAGVDEVKALAECQRVLRPGGRLILNCAAYDCLRGRHDDATCGVRRYTPARVGELLKKQGLEINVLHGWNAWIFLPMVLWRMLSRKQSPAATQEAPRSDLFRLPGWVERLLAFVTTCDFKLCRALHFPLGTSIYAVATKPVSAAAAH